MGRRGYELHSGDFVDQPGGPIDQVRAQTMRYETEQRRWRVLFAQQACFGNALPRSHGRLQPIAQQVVTET
jgi:hypothetical protein